MAGADHALVRFGGIEFSAETIGGLTDFSSSRWVSLNIETGEFKPLFENLSGVDFGYYVESAGALLATLPGREKEAIFARIDLKNTASAGPSRFREGNDELTYALHKVNLERGGDRRLKQGRAETHRWLVDETGNIIARVDFNESANELRFFVTRGNSSPLTSTLSLDEQNFESVVVIGRGHAPGLVVVRVKDKDGDHVYRQFNMETGELTSDLYDPKGSSISERYDPQTARAHAVVVDKGAEIYHFDPDLRSVQASMEKALSGARILIESASADGNIMLLKAHYPIKPSEWYLYDRSAKRLEIVGQN